MSPAVVAENEELRLVYSLYSELCLTFVTIIPSAQACEQVTSSIRERASHFSSARCSFVAHKLDLCSQGRGCSLRERECSHIWTEGARALNATFSFSLTQSSRPKIVRTASISILNAMVFNSFCIVSEDISDLQKERDSGTMSCSRCDHFQLNPSSSLGL